MELIESLLTPTDEPYDLDAQALRIRQLNRLYDELDADPFKAAAVAKLVARSFWAWCALVAWTEDEKDPHLPRKPFPPFVYIKAVAETLTAKDADGRFCYDSAAIEKSRQMIITHLAVQRLNQLCVTRPSTLCVVGSKTEDHAVGLLYRARFSYEQLPTWLLRHYGLPFDSSKIFKAETAAFPNRSRIKTIAERGGEAARSDAATFTVLDEAGFQPDFPASWGAVQGGAQSARGYTSVWAIGTCSTKWNLFFRDLCEDRKDGVVGGVERVLHQSRGCRITLSKSFKIAHVELDYFADPGKTSAEWEAQARAQMSDDMWQLDMGRNWDAMGGKPLFPMWDHREHLLPTEPRIEYAIKSGGWHVVYPQPDGEDWYVPITLGLGIDHGLRNPCGAILLGADPYGDLWALWDYSETGRTANENARAIIAELKAFAGDGQPDPLLDAPYQAIDAMHPLADRSHGKIEDLYRWEWIPDGQGGYVQGEPLLWQLKTCQKGAGSIGEGINVISDWLTATLATRKPGHHYFTGKQTPPEAIAGWAKRPRLWISPRCVALAAELSKGRYADKRDPNLNQPEIEYDAHNHVRKALTYCIKQGLQYLGPKP